MKSVKCGIEERVKNGYNSGKPRYKFQCCGYSYTVGLKSAAKSAEVKQQASLMYLKGLRFYSTGRILKVSHVSVLSMIRKYGREVEAIRRYKPVIALDLDLR